MYRLWVLFRMCICGRVSRRMLAYWGECECLSFGFRGGTATVLTCDKMSERFREGCCWTEKFWASNKCSLVDPGGDRTSRMLFLHHAQIIMAPWTKWSMNFCNHFPQIFTELCHLWIHEHSLIWHQSLMRESLLGRTFVPIVR